MEIKINKEIRSYKETIFFGLSMRQFICSVLSVGAAVALHFGLKDADIYDSITVIGEPAD